MLLQSASLSISVLNVYARQYYKNYHRAEEHNPSHRQLATNLKIFSTNLNELCMIGISPSAFVNLQVQVSTLLDSATALTSVEITTVLFAFRIEPFWTSSISLVGDAGGSDDG